MGELAHRELPPAAELTSSLRNGVALAKLAKTFDMSPKTQNARTYDADETIYKVSN